MLTVLEQVSAEQRFEPKHLGSSVAHAFIIIAVVLQFSLCWNPLADLLTH